MTPEGAVLQADESVLAALELVLGGSSVEPFPGRLDHVALKRAYRRRAHDLHPDKACAWGVPPATLEPAFRELKEAYELLARTIGTHSAITLPLRVPCGADRGGEQDEGQARSDRWRHSSAAPTSPAGGDVACAENGPTFEDDDPARACPVPRRRLRFAQYLFFNRVIDGPTLTAAINWQRGSRPRCGEIARRLEYLTGDAIARVLGEQGPDEPFGEAAVRLTCLDRPRVLTVLARQRRFDRPIGRFFVERAILSPAELRRLLARQWSHNLAFAIESLSDAESA